MAIPLIVAGIISSITAAMQASSELAPSIANDVSIWRQAFSTGNNKKQLMALRAQAINSAAQLGAIVEQQRIELNSSRDAVTAQLEVFKEKFSSDGQITVEEFAFITGLQNIAASINAGYRHLQAIDSLRQQLAAASAAPTED